MPCCNRDAMVKCPGGSRSPERVEYNFNILPPQNCQDSFKVLTNHAISKGDPSTLLKYTKQPVIFGIQEPTPAFP